MVEKFVLQFIFDCYSDYRLYPCLGLWLYFSLSTLPSMFADIIGQHIKGLLIRLLRDHHINVFWILIMPLIIHFTALLTVLRGTEVIVIDYDKHNILPIRSSSKIMKIWP